MSRGEFGAVTPSCKIQGELGEASRHREALAPAGPQGGVAGWRGCSSLSGRGARENTMENTPGRFCSRLPVLCASWDPAQCPPREFPRFAPRCPPRGFSGVLAFPPRDTFAQAVPFCLILTSLKTPSLEPPIEVSSFVGCVYSFLIGRFLCKHA